MKSTLTPPASATPNRPQLTSSPICGLLAQRRKHNQPGNDLISDLIAVTDTDGARLSEDELAATVVLLFMAGHEASVNVVGNGVLALMRHRDQWQRLINDPGLAAPAVEELIRYDSPLQLFERTATTDVTIAGFSVPAGHKIAVLLGAAGGDPHVFPQPDHLDISRTPNPPRLRSRHPLLPRSLPGPHRSPSHPADSLPPPAHPRISRPTPTTTRIRHPRPQPPSHHRPIKVSADSPRPGSHGLNEAALAQITSTSFMSSSSCVVIWVGDVDAVG
jgi:cytochrome P450